MGLFCLDLRRYIYIYQMLLSKVISFIREPTIFVIYNGRLYTTQYIVYFSAALNVAHPLRTMLMKVFIKLSIFYDLFSHQSVD